MEVTQEVVRAGHPVSGLYLSIPEHSSVFLDTSSAFIKKIYIYQRLKQTRDLTLEARKHTINVPNNEEKSIVKIRHESTNS